MDARDKKFHIEDIFLCPQKIIWTSEQMCSGFTYEQGEKNNGTIHFPRHEKAMYYSIWLKFLYQGVMAWTEISPCVNTHAQLMIVADKWWTHI